LELQFGISPAETLRISFFPAVDTPDNPGFHQGFAEVKQIVSFPVILCDFASLRETLHPFQMLYLLNRRRVPRGIFSSLISSPVMILPSVIYNVSGLFQFLPAMLYGVLPPVTNPP
jgi:hypothetical protein